MRPRIATAVSVLLIAACAEGHEEPARRPLMARPVAVMLQHDVWEGSEEPWLVVYEDGTVLSPRERDGGGWPLSYQLSRVEVSGPGEALARFGIGNDFMRLDSAYDLRPGWSDQRTAHILVWDGHRHRQVSVRAAHVTRNRLSGSVPAAFRRAFDRMADYRPRGARLWRPDTLDVSVWSYDHAPDDPPLPWPSGWPDLNTPGTRAEPNPAVDTVYTISLSAEHEPELKRLLARQREKQAIGMNGRKWTVTYRIRIPGEHAWRSQQLTAEP